MSETKPARKKGKKRALTLRYKLFTTLFLVCLATLLLVWTCLERLLQPQYNAFIHDKLENKLEVLATASFDQAAEDGTVISAGYVRPDAEPGLLGQGEREHQQRAGEPERVAWTFRTRPCAASIRWKTCTLPHSRGGDGIKFGQGTSTWDTSTAIALRQYAFEKGSLYKILETESGTQQMVVGRTAAGGQYAILVSCLARGARRTPCWAAAAHGGTGASGLLPAGGVAAQPVDHPPLVQLSRCGPADCPRATTTCRTRARGRIRPAGAGLQTTWRAR